MKDTIKCEFTIEESNLIIKSLNLLRNYLSKQERTTETVDEIIIKITEYGKIEIDKPKPLTAKAVDENPYMASGDANIHHDGYNTDSTDEVLPLRIYPEINVS